MNMNSIWKLFISPKYPEKELEDYYDNLQVEFDYIAMKNNNFYEPIRANITDLLESKDKSWPKAYKVAKYLAYLYDENDLDANLEHCNTEFQAHLASDTCNYYVNELNELAVNKDGCIEKKRSLLLRMQRELHSFYIKRSEFREYTFLVRLRVTFLCLLGILLFLSSLAYCYYSDYLKTSSEMITLSISSGVMGATFSMIIGLKEQLNKSTMEDLKILHRISYLIKRVAIDIGGASIGYFLIQSGMLGHIISEDLLPHLPIEDNQLIIESYTNISKLIIWSYIAGFSELLVPGLLNRVENKISHKKSTM